MTILPKKKPSKEKGEVENPDHSQRPHSPATTEARSSRRSTTSPQRWNSPPPVDPDRHVALDPGSSRYEEFNSGDPAFSHKRRHPSPSHRSLRKYRHESHKNSIASGSSSHQSSYAHNRLPNVRCVGTSTVPDRRGNTTQLNVKIGQDDEEYRSGCNSEDEYGPASNPENSDELEHYFEKALAETKGYIIKKMREDGACLFRAVADQVYGDQEMHATVRQNCVEYMAKNADFFKQYVTEDFTTYLNRKRVASSHGNHIEIQALCELYNRPVEVYQRSLEPINTFHASYQTDNEPIRLSYHGRTHYNSVVNPNKATIGVGLGLPGYQPGLAEKNLLRDAARVSEDCHIEQTMLEDKLRETDWEVTQETIEEQVARESYLQWLRDQESRAKMQASPRTASASCSKASESQGSWWDSVGSPDNKQARSPKLPSATNSAQNSPKTIEMDELAQSSKMADSLLLPGGAPSSPAFSTLGTSSDASFPTPLEVATGGIGISSETASLMNELPPEMFGFLEYEDEDSVLARVMAQSQQEYFNSLKKQNKTDPRPADDYATAKDDL